MDGMVQKGLIHQLQCIHVFTTFPLKTSEFSQDLKKDAIYEQGITDINPPVTFFN